MKISLKGIFPSNDCMNQRWSSGCDKYLLLYILFLKFGIIFIISSGGFDLHIISRCGENGEICWHSLEIHNSIAHTLASNNVHVYQL